MTVLVIGPYRVKFNKFECSHSIESRPQNHPSYGMIPGTIRFEAKYEWQTEKNATHRVAPEAWHMDNDVKWELGFYQVVESIERAVYRWHADTKHLDNSGFAARLGKTLHLTGHQYQTNTIYSKQAISLRTAHRDAAADPHDTRKPWYDGKPETSVTFSRIHEDRNGTRKMGDAPGVRNSDVEVCGMKQSNSKFATYLVLMKQDRKFGVTLYEWKWTADFVYYKDPRTSIESTRGGIQLTSSTNHLESTPSYNERGLPDGCPAADTTAISVLDTLNRSAQNVAIQDVRSELGV